jgi:hypothetical protein
MSTSPPSIVNSEWIHDTLARLCRKYGDVHVAISLGATDWHRVAEEAASRRWYYSDGRGMQSLVFVSTVCDPVLVECDPASDVPIITVRRRRDVKGSTGSHGWPTCYWVRV